MQKLIKWFRDLSIKLASTIVFFFITCIFSLLATFVPYIRKLIFGNFVTIYITASIILFIVFAFAFVYKHIKFYCVYINKEKIEFEYELYELKFDIINRYKSVCYFHIIYKSKKDTSTFPTKYNWTGSSNEVIPDTKGLTCIKNTCANENEQWILELPRKYRKNETIDISFHIVCHDEKQKSIPFLQYNVNQPTKKVKLKVTFPQETDLNCLTKQNFVGNTDYVKESVSGDTSEKEFTYEVKHPKLLDRYRIEWKIEKAVENGCNTKRMLYNSN